MHDESELRSETLPGWGQRRGREGSSNTQLPIGLFPRCQGEPASASASSTRDNHLVIVSIMAGSRNAPNKVSAIKGFRRLVI